MSRHCDSRNNSLGASALGQALQTPAEFGCHRGTISAVLKRQGITVSSKLSDRPALVERVLQMYADGMHGKQIGSELGISPGSVSKILHDNGVRIRRSTEYVKS